MNQDGNSIGITAPNADSQADVIERACEDAGISAETISYIEAHGTGTTLGDPIEIDGIEKAFSKYTSKKQFCAIGSVKSNIGHLYDLSGMASIVKAVLALNKQMIPPTIHFERPNEKIDFADSPVYVNTELSPWKPDCGTRRCGISSFGLSGTNVHVILEENNRKDKTEQEFLIDKKTYIFTVSAKNKISLMELLKRYQSCFAREKLPLRDVCYTSSVGRGHYNLRLCIAVDSMEQLKSELTEITESRMITEKENVWYGERKEQGNQKENGSLEKEIRILTAKAGQLLEEPVQDNQQPLEKLKLLCHFYVQGADISWKQLYKGEKANRVRLPVYPFYKKRCWAGLEHYIARKKENTEKMPAVQECSVILEGRENNTYSDTEKRLAEIFHAIMGFTRVNIYDNFSTLGGDSLLLGKAHKRIQDSFEGNISVTDLFTYPTISELAQYIESSHVQLKQHVLDIEQEKKTYTDKDIAVIGMSGYFPGAENVNEFWENIKNGVDCITDFPRSRKKDVDVFLHGTKHGSDSVKYLRAGYLEQIDKFDYRFFGISPKEASLMDPNQRLFLETAWKAIEDAGYTTEQLYNTKTGVYVGYANDLLNSYGKFINEAEPESSAISLAGNLPSIIPGRLSYYLNLKGPSMLIDTACSSSLAAVHLARKSMLDGECDMAVAEELKLICFRFEKKIKI